MKDRQKAIISVHILLKKENKILLAKRKNTGIYDGLFDLPGGHIEDDESLIDALQREVYEELEIRIDKPKLIHIMYRSKHESRGDNRINFFFKTESWEPYPIIKEKELCSELRWENINKLPSNTIPFISKALMYIEREILLSEIGWE